MTVQYLVLFAEREAKSYQAFNGLKHCDIWETGSFLKEIKLTKKLPYIQYIEKPQFPNCPHFIWIISHIFLFHQTELYLGQKETFHRNFCIFKLL